MSALWSYPLCLITSGDIQYGVPTNVFFFADSVPDSCPDTPKSASLTSPFAESRMFAAAGSEHRTRGWGGAHLPLMSRCSLFSLCRYSSPRRSSRTTIAMYSSRNTPGFICAWP
jgi:hypothetical protein